MNDHDVNDERHHMDTNGLLGLALQSFTGLSDADRLDRADDVRGHLAKLGNDIESGTVDADAHTAGALYGAAFALQMVTEGRLRTN